MKQHLNLFKETKLEKQYVGMPFQDVEINVKECCSDNLMRYYAFLYIKDIRRPNRKEERQSLTPTSFSLTRGALGDTQYRNTVRKIGKYRNTALSKIDEITIPHL